MTGDASPVFRGAVAHFPAAVNAVPQARATTIRTLTGWAVGSDAVELGELVACELTSNAVKASRPDDVVGLRLTVCDAVLTVEVWDASTALPILSTPAQDQEGGRGLILVDAVCLRWAWYLPLTGGKVTWAQLPAATRPIMCTASAAPLPTRVPVTGPAPSPAIPPTFETDPTVLQRVIDRLRGLDDWHRPPPGGVMRGQYGRVCRGSPRPYPQLTATAGIAPAAETDCAPVACADGAP
ncbi:ATP-binding protein [Frankia sp. AgPm24]|uniref:ATP-binding protein n=1 Tax=Frankia sp. AgPm24 TaxID=631128 RepID=UPI0035B256B3